MKTSRTDTSDAVFVLKPAELGAQDHLLHIAVMVVFFSAGFLTKLTPEAAVGETKH